MNTVTIKHTDRGIYHDYKIIDPPENEKCDTCENQIIVYVPSFAYRCCKCMSCIKK